MRYGMVKLLIYQIVLLFSAMFEKRHFIHRFSISTMSRVADSIAIAVEIAVSYVNSSVESSFC